MHEDEERAAEIAGDEIRLNESIEDFHAGIQAELDRWARIDDALDRIQCGLGAIDGVVAHLQERVAELTRDIKGEVGDER
jgi:hypothetical protein